MSASACIAAIAAGVRACRSVTLLGRRVTAVTTGIGIAAVWIGVVTTRSAACAAGVFHYGYFAAVLEFVETSDREHLAGTHTLHGCGVSVGGAYRDSA